MESDCNSESSVDGYDSELEEASVNSDMKCELSELPLCQRLAVQNSEESISAVAQDKVQKRRRLERFRGIDDIVFEVSDFINVMSLL